MRLRAELGECLRIRAASPAEGGGRRSLGLVSTGKQAFLAYLTEALLLPCLP
jgi:hypothetical protein